MRLEIPYAEIVVAPLMRPETYIKHCLHEAGFDFSKPITTHQDFDRDVLIVEQEELTR